MAVDLAIEVAEKLIDEQHGRRQAPRAGRAVRQGPARVGRAPPARLAAGCRKRPPPALFKESTSVALSIGIVGLPNVGKSTLFNALSAAGAQAANYPFCTIEPNVGVVPVPDERLDKLSALVKPLKKIPTSLEFVDIAGLVRGASQGRGPGQPVPRQHPPGGRGAARAALLRGRQRHPRRGRRGPGAGPGHRRHRAVPQGPGDGREAPRARPAATPRRAARRATRRRPSWRCWTRSRPGSTTGITVRAQKLYGRRARGRSASCSCSPTSRCSTWRTSPRAQLGKEDADPHVQRGAGDGGEGGRRGGGARRGDGGGDPAAARRRSARASWRASGLDRAGPAQGGARRLQAARACRRTSPWASRSAAPGPSTRAGKAPQAAGVIHTDFERGFIKAEVMRWEDLIKLGSEAARAARRACCAWKARSTSSRTATACTSASTCSDARSLRRRSTRKHPLRPQST